MVERLGFTHLWIALAAGLCTAASFRIFNGTLAETESNSFALLAGIWTGWTYTFQRWMKFYRTPEQMPRIRLDFWKRHGGQMLIGWSFAVILSTVIVPFYMGWEMALLMRAVPMAFAVGIFSIGYAFNPLGDQRGWRDRAHMKLPVIAIGWAIATIGIPASLSGIDWNSPVAWGMGASQFLFVAGITVPFDVRDISIDPHSLQTWPQRFGSSHAIRRACLVLAVSACGFYLCDPHWIRAGVAAVTMPFVAWSVMPRREVFYSLLLDGLLIAQGVAVLGWMAL